MKEFEIPLKCECSKVEGVIRIKSGEGNNIVCHCDDCQRFADYLGKKDIILNENLGTELFQITPNKLEITKGKEHLACMQLKPKGLIRWYTACCKTPVANTINGKMAFNGVFHKFMDFSSFGEPKEAALGNVLTYCMSRYSKGELPSNSHPKYPMGVFLRIIKMILSGFILKTNKPNQFFCEETLKPIVEPVHY
jgi:hypothetical protein